MILEAKKCDLNLKSYIKQLSISYGDLNQIDRNCIFILQYCNKKSVILQI